MAERAADEAEEREERTAHNAGHAVAQKKERGRSREPRPRDRGLSARPIARVETGASERHRHGEPRRPSTTSNEKRETMPKNKTHSGAKKRFKVTGIRQAAPPAGRPKSGAAFASAPTTGSRKKHRQKSGDVDVAKADVKAAKKLLGR